MRFAHRQFDPRWLDDGNANFDLIAVVNRLDRRAFAPEHCGEVRVIHRLSYNRQMATGMVESRLPMTVNTVYFVDPGIDPNCAAVARSWLRPDPPPKAVTRVRGSDAFEQGHAPHQAGAQQIAAGHGRRQHGVLGE